MRCAAQLQSAAGFAFIMDGDDRRVRPLAILGVQRRVAVREVAELRNDFLAFRINRIASIEETGESFVNAPGQSLQTYLAMKFFAAQSRSWLA